MGGGSKEYYAEVVVPMADGVHKASLALKATQVMVSALAEAGGHERLGQCSEKFKDFIMDFALQGFAIFRDAFSFLAKEVEDSTKSEAHKKLTSIISSCSDAAKVKQHSGALLKIATDPVVCNLFVCFQNIDKFRPRVQVCAGVIKASLPTVSSPDLVAWSRCGLAVETCGFRRPPEATR